ncbi:hypothetical protein [Nocardia gamkensis]|uniref:hypothetical protein n=1 Tax=Nocardia gamkensis TaxID=352869 RepID=UPI0037C9C126
MAERIDAIEQQVQATVGQFSTALRSRKLEGFNLETGLDLDATARRILQAGSPVDDDGLPLITVDTDGFCYTIHLSASAVTMITADADAFSEALGDAVRNVPDVAALFFPLLSFIHIASDEIEAVSQNGAGPVKLNGVFLSPVALPSPEDAYYWENKKAEHSEEMNELGDDLKDNDLKNAGWNEDYPNKDPFKKKKDPFKEDENGKRL